jgi:aspartate/methionine/tyrosine aminotransferase
MLDHSMSLAQRIANLRPTAVNRVLQEVRQLQAEGRDLISLMRGEPAFTTPAHIVDAANKALRDGLTRYPDNRGELILRKAVAEKLCREQGLEYDPDGEILVTDGATSGLFASLGALVNPGDEVLLPDPIYDAYQSPIAMWGAMPAPVRSQIHNGRFSFDRAALEAARTPRSRVLLLNTPWNPTGTVLTQAELQEYMDFAAKANLHVISDEIYENLVYDGRRHVSPASISQDAKRRTIIVNSFSKTYAMTGWRVGYCAGPAQIIQAMLLVLQQYSRGPAMFVQHGAAAALSGDQSCARVMAADYHARRDGVLALLSGLPAVPSLVPQGGFFVMLDVRALRMPSDEVRRHLLREAGVVVIHGAAYGEGGEGTLRVSFAAGGADLDEGLRRLRDRLQRLVDLDQSTK